MELSGLMSYYIDLGLYITDEMVSQVALMMKIGCLKVLEIGDITCSQCMSLLKELPHCTCLQTLGVTLSKPHLQVRVLLKSKYCWSLLHVLLTIAPRCNSMPLSFPTRMYLTLYSSPCHTCLLKYPLPFVMYV